MQQAKRASDGAVAVNSPPIAQLNSKPLMAINNSKNLGDQGRAGLGKLQQTRTLTTDNAEDQVRLDELRKAWGILQGSPIIVIGRLTSKQTDDNKTLYFLENLENPTTGVGLLYPGQDSSAARALVFASEVSGLDASKRPWAIAELRLSPIEHREKRNNFFECTVRPGSFRLLREIPADWGIDINGHSSVRRMSDAALAAIETQNRDQQNRLKADLAQLERTRNALHQKVEELRNQAVAEDQKATEIKERLMNEIHAIQERLTRLSDLLADKGQRLIELGLIDTEDLHALLPTKSTREERPKQDYQALLGADFAQLAPFVQARLWKTGMLFTQAQLRDFLALLRTHDVIVLAGDSGSGKTSLVRTVAESIGGRCAVIPVKPNWTGPEDLLGYYNPIERSYQPTPFLLALQAAQAEPDVPHFICLDEMNLARVEHYFADFLSLLETRKGTPMVPLYTSDEERHAVIENGFFLSIEAEVRARAGLPDTATLEDILRNEEANDLLHRLGGFKDAESVLLHHARLRRSLAAVTRTPTTLQLPPNVRIIGTVNIDDTTHYLSPKVLDRVHVLRFRNPVLVDWDTVEAEVQTFNTDLHTPVRLDSVDLGTRDDYPPFDRHDPDATFLAGLARRHLDPLGVEFGLRAIRQSLHYLQHAKRAGIAPKAALNNVVLHKVLPKLMLDLGRTTHDGKSRRDILLALRAELAEGLQEMSQQSVSESSIDALDHLIAMADSNNGIANYWLR